MCTKQVGRAMKALRNSKGWSIDYEADLLQIHRNTLANYEEDAENMSFKLFRKFLGLHNITMDSFFKEIYDNSLISECFSNQ